MLAYVADKVEEGPVLHPVVVVDKLGPVGSIAVEIKEMTELLPDAGHIVAQGFEREEIPLLRFARRVSDHSGRAAHKCDRFVPAFLEMLQYHYTDKMPDVKRVRSRVDSDICGRRAFHQFFFSSGHNVLNHAPPFEFLYKILHRMNVICDASGSCPRPGRPFQFSQDCKGTIFIVKFCRNE